MFPNRAVCLPSNPRLPASGLAFPAKFLPRASTAPRMHAIANRPSTRGASDAGICDPEHGHPRHAKQRGAGSQEPWTTAPPPPADQNGSAQKRCGLFHCLETEHARKGTRASARSVPVPPARAKQGAKRTTGLVTRDSAHCRLIDKHRSSSIDHPTYHSASDSSRIARSAGSPNLMLTTPAGPTIILDIPLAIVSLARRPERGVSF